MSLPHALKWEGFGGGAGACAHTPRSCRVPLLGMPISGLCQTLQKDMTQSPTVTQVLRGLCVASPTSPDFQKQWRWVED